MEEKKIETQKDEKQSDVGGYIQLEEKNSIKFTSIESSPCTTACPVGTNVKSYVSLIAAGKFSEALEVIRKTNPFPGICGRVCPHPCEEKCNRNDIDKPVSIAALKRFLADYELQRGIIPLYKKMDKKSGKVAIVGSGPAGLTCAADLARLGYSVVVYEALPVPGGLLAVGIPEYRLPKDVLNVEIDAIKNLGIEIVLNTKIGDSIKLTDLKKQYNAVFIATGAHKPVLLGIPGEQDIKEGIINWMDLLKDSALNNAEKPGDDVIVIGGGNSAIDSARVALRLGAKKVTILYRRSREQMPAFSEEVDAVEEEGINLQLLCAPVKLIHNDGKLIGIECMRMKLGELDESNRAKPVPIEHSQFIMPCDTIISAIGQKIDDSVIQDFPLKLSRRNLIKADPLSLATSGDGIFAGGDVIAGPASVIEAIAAGHRAAESIHHYISGIPLPQHAKEKQKQELTIQMPKAAISHRREPQRVPLTARKRSFIEIDEVYTQKQAIEEAQRCLRCGFCNECESCVSICEKKQALIEPQNQTLEERLMGNLKLIRITSDIHHNLEEREDIPVIFNNEPFTLSPFTARVKSEQCRGCGLCEETCGFAAIRVVYRQNGIFSAQVNNTMCRGCGSCVSVCPTNAIDQAFFTHNKLAFHISEIIAHDQQKIVHFSCHWNAENGFSFEQKNAWKIPVMCSGRITSGEILKTFEQGATGVLIHCCKDGNCHYSFGCDVAKLNFDKVYAILDLLGIKKERMEILHADQDVEKKIENFMNTIKTLGPIWKGEEK